MIRRLSYSLLCLLLMFTIIAPVVHAETNYSVLCTQAYDCSFYEPGADSCVTASGVGTALSGSGNGEKVFNYFISKGFDNLHAAAITGNLQLESNFSTTVDNGQGFHGLAQWGGGRWTKLQSKENYTNLAVQLDFVWNELNGGYKSTLNDFKKNNSINETTYIIGRYYEVAIQKGSKPYDVQGYAKRLAYAKQWLQKSGPGSTTITETTQTDTQSQTASACPTDTVFSGGSCSIATEGQYSESQLRSIFGDPGTYPKTSAQMEAKLKSVDFNGHSVRVHELAAGCLEDVAAEIKSSNIQYTIKQIGCYRFDADKPPSNIGTKSYHTYGVACDINSSTNPFSGSGSPLPHDMPQDYISIFRKHGFTWGGDWHSVKDYMHFEYHGIKT